MSLSQTARAMLRHQIRFAGQRRWFVLPEGVTLRQVNRAAREVLKRDPVLAAEHTRAMRIEFGLERGDPK